LQAGKQEVTSAQIHGKYTLIEYFFYFTVCATFAKYTVVTLDKQKHVLT